MGTIEGGWMAREVRPKDVRVTVLTSDPNTKWNLYHAILKFRDSRELQLDPGMLPRRTQDYLNEQYVRFDELATDNRVLYEQILPRSTRSQSHMQGLRLPFMVTMIDHYYYIFTYYAVIPKAFSWNGPLVR
jgi:hypothetical protein